MSDKPIVYKENGRIIYRASAFGSCVRALTAARLGYEASEPPESLQEVFEAGHEAEAWVGTMLPIEDSQGTVGMYGEKWGIVGHIDGRTPSGNLVEIKSQSKERYETWTEDSWINDPLWAKYAWQVSVYMHATGKPLGVIRVCRPGDEGRDYSYFHTIYQKPFHSEEAVINRIHLLDDLAALETLPPCDSTLAFGCPYWKLHEQVEITLDTELEEAAAAYLEAKFCVAGCEAELKVAREHLYKVLGDRSDVNTGRYKVKKTTFDKKEYTVKARTETRLTVTETK